MNHTQLQGWDIEIKRITIQEPVVEDGEAKMVPAEGWSFVFTEKIPPTGDTLTWAFGKGVRDAILKGLTGGVVVPDIELPRAL